MRAKIHTINGFSAHAGQGELLRWFEPMSTHRPRVLLTHGEDKQRASLSEALRARFKVAPELPAIGDFVELDRSSNRLGPVRVNAADRRILVRAAGSALLTVP